MRRRLTMGEMSEFAAESDNANFARRRRRRKGGRRGLKTAGLAAAGLGGAALLGTGRGRGLLKSGYKKGVSGAKKAGGYGAKQAGRARRAGVNAKNALGMKMIDKRHGPGF